MYNHRPYSILRITIRILLNGGDKVVVGTVRAPKITQSILQPQWSYCKLLETYLSQLEKKNGRWLLLCVGCSFERCDRMSTPGLGWRQLRDVAPSNQNLCKVDIFRV